MWYGSWPHCKGIKDQGNCFSDIRGKTFLIRLKIKVHVHVYLKQVLGWLLQWFIKPLIISWKFCIPWIAFYLEIPEIKRNEEILFQILLGWCYDRSQILSTGICEC